MPASQEQKVDFLLKKIGYSASKTGIAEDSSLSGSTKKAPFAEAIASPLVIPSSTIWSESGLIPATPPSSNTAYVGIYTAANAYRMTYDNTVGAARRTFIARSSYGNQSSSIDGDWIDTQFGADYIVQVYKGDPNSGGVSLQQAGANAGTDGWFFDYSSGVLNFNGTNLPSGIGTDNVYVLGYRYIGRKGVQPAAGLGTFHDLVVSNNLSVGGISTFSGLIDANGIIEATAGQNKIPSLYQNFSDLPNAGTYHGMFAHVHALGRGYFAHGGAWYELVNKESNGVVGTGTESYNIGSLVVSGVTTSGNIGISTGVITGPSVTYIDPATVGDDTGTLVIKGDLQVEGTQTVVNSSTMTVTDKNIELAKGAANDAAADGGGITVDSGDGDKTWQWVDATDSWTSSEHIRIPDNKVFGFASDTNTFISRPSADTIAITQGGIEKIRFQNGNIGIGTTTPTARLHVSGGDAASAIIKIEDNNNNIAASEISVQNGGRDLRIAAPNDIFFQKLTGTSLLYLENGQRVGINTNNPESLLHLQGTGGNTSGLRFENGAGKNVTFYLSNNTSGSQFAINYGGTGGSEIQIHNNGNVVLAPSGSSLVGIGTYTPTSTLDVKGDTKLQGNINVTGVSTFQDNIFVGTGATVGLGSTVYFKDNARAVFGDNQDLKIYHNGESFISHTGSGVFKIQGNGGNNTFLRAKDAQNSITLVPNAGVIAHYNGGVRFETTGIGATVFGQLNTTDLKVTGVSTFTGAIDANSNLDVAGIATLGSGGSGSVDLQHQGTTRLTTQTWGTRTEGTIQALNGNVQQYKSVANDTGSLLLTNNTGNAFEIGHTSSNSFITGHVGNISINAPQVSISTDFSVSGVSTFSNTTFTGTISAGSTTGTDGYYLKTTGVGVTWAQFPTARNSQVFAATAGQTTFSFTYNVNYLDVFVNGVKLPASEFTASNGTSVVLDDGCFVNDTVELITYNTVPSSSSGAQSLNQLNDITITGSPVIGETLQHNGSAFVNDYTVSATTTSTSQTAILSLPVATYRSAEYTIQVTEGTKYHVTKVLAIHDGTNVTFNEYGTLTTSTSLSTFALDVNSGNMRLLATPASTNSTVFKVKFTGIKV